MCSVRVDLVFSCLCSRFPFGISPPSVVWTQARTRFPKFVENAESLMALDCWTCLALWYQYRVLMFYFFQWIFSLISSPPGFVFTNASLVKAHGGFSISGFWASLSIDNLFSAAIAVLKDVFHVFCGKTEFWYNHQSCFLCVVQTCVRIWYSHYRVYLWSKY